MRRGSGQRNKLARLGREEEAASGPTRRRGGSAFRCSLRVVDITPVWCLLSMCFRVLKRKEAWVREALHDSLRSLLGRCCAINPSGSRLLWRLKSPTPPLALRRTRPATCPCHVRKAQNLGEAITSRQATLAGEGQPRALPRQSWSRGGRASITGGRGRASSRQGQGFRLALVCLPSGAKHPFPMLRNE